MKNLFPLDWEHFEYWNGTLQMLGASIVSALLACIHVSVTDILNNNFHNFHYYLWGRIKFYSDKTEVKKDPAISQAKIFSWDWVQLIWLLKSCIWSLSIVCPMCFLTVRYIILNDKAEWSYQTLKSPKIKILKFKLLKISSQEEWNPECGNPECWNSQNYNYHQGGKKL